MFKNLRPWHLVTALVTVCLLVLGVMYYLRWRGTGSAASMIACLPRSGNVVLYLDIDALRQSGVMDLITGSKATADIEYQQFVDGTGFDYRRDLHSLAASFSGRNTYVVLRGNFNWRRLNGYALSRGGTCRASFCMVPGEERRFVSYYPVRSDMLAIAFSFDQMAALDISPRSGGQIMHTPAQPVWISVTGPGLKDVPKLPAGARSFVSPLESAENIIVSAGQSGEKMKLSAEVLCASTTTASDLLVKLEGATNMLRKMLARENMQPNPRDLSGILARGDFRRDDRKVFATWPLDREFIESLASGGVD